MDKVTGQWRGLHNKELYALLSLPSTIQVIKSRRLRWAGHVACMGDWGRGEIHTGFQWGNLREGVHFDVRGVDGRIILKWILEKLNGGYGLDQSGSRQGQVAGSSECGDEPSVSIKCREFLDQLRTCQLCFVSSETICRGLPEEGQMYSYLTQDCAVVYSADSSMTALEELFGERLITQRQ